MKLKQLKIIESVIPFHYEYALSKIIANDGALSDPTQVFLLGGLSNLLKEHPWRWPRDLNSYEMTTSADDVEAIRNMSASEILKAAKQIKQHMAQLETYESDPSCCPMTTVEFLQHMAQKNS